MKLTRTRKISQAFFLALFLFLLFAAESGRMRGYPINLFLKADPLLAIGTALSARTLYSGMILALAILIPTIFLGRFFCGWICPLGALNDACSRAFRPRERAARIEANRYRRWFGLKFYVLTAFLALAVFGVAQFGLLDPIAFLTRSLSASIMPAIGAVTGGRVLPDRVFQAGWLLGAALLAVLLLNAVVPRFYCRAICPLGALLGTVARLGVFRVHRSDPKCIHCDRCLEVCPAAADPQEKLRKAECYVCMNCREVCPTDAITFRTMPPESGAVVAPDVSRRRILKAAVVAALGFPLIRAAFRGDRLPPRGLIRPPGSEPEASFLGKCVKCGECMKVCPTNVIQPALLEGGAEALWTPVMINRIGYCEYNCHLCGRACPTGAIREFSLEEKQGLPPFEKPIKLGTAFVDRTRCLPWAMNTPCIVCEEMCPVSPKAIYIEEAEVVNSSGRRLTVQRPVVDPARCIGCGLCENRCPVFDQRAIRVSSVGESRSERNQLLLPGTDEASPDAPIAFEQFSEEG